MTEQQREHQRFPTRLAAEVNTGQETFGAWAKNLSMGGVGLELDRPVEAQTLIAISMFLVEDGIEDATVGALEVHGQLIWIAPLERGGYEGGVRFAPIQPAHARLLQDFLNRLIPRT
ncbi:MAG: PilZ domain-containing protein [Proteobacteria bacterium]|nr:PilZ domain-containing protein [Pseudomonadota bacterium]